MVCLTNKICTRREASTYKSWLPACSRQELSRWSWVDVFGIYILEIVAWRDNGCSEIQKVYPDRLGWLWLNANTDKNSAFVNVLSDNIEILFTIKSTNRSVQDLLHFLLSNAILFDEIIIGWSVFLIQNLLKVTPFYSIIRSRIAILNAI